MCTVEKNLFDTGLKLDMLQEYILIPLDIFWETVQNKDRIDRLDGWLTFIGTDKPEDILWLIERYPEFEEIYREGLSLPVSDGGADAYVFGGTERTGRQYGEVHGGKAAGGDCTAERMKLTSSKEEREQQAAEIARLEALLAAKK